MKQKTQLYRCLADSCIDYLALSPLDETQVKIQFTGHFEGNPVLWTATIIALKAPEIRSDANARANTKENQYINITLDKCGSTLREVEVGLPVNSVDESTILKTMTMLRQFKNLRRGRYEYKGLYKDPR